MVDLAPDQIINLSVAIILLIPAGILTKNYRITGITDFLLFTGVFLASSIASFASVIVSIDESLIYYQINVGMINLTFLLLYIHGLRMRFPSFKKSILLSSFGIGYFIILTIIILFWKLQFQPDTSFVIFTIMKASAAPAHPDGAGFSIDDNIIYSTSYYLIGLLFWIFSLVFLLWAYTTVNVIKPTKNILSARKLWIAVWTIDLVWAVLLLPIFPQISEINILVVVANVLIIYINVKYPESSLISNDQIIRYQGLYKRIKQLEVKKGKNVGMTSLIEYLEKLPDDLTEN